MAVTLNDLRRFAVTRSLFRPTTLKNALERMGFVQADPIRAPARAQDLILRQRVANYQAGDLERRYPTIDIEEDFFVVYGFVTQSVSALMHPRSNAGVPAEGSRPWSTKSRQRAQRLLAFVRKRGAVHPREVDDYFAHGTVRNYWGGASSATTQLLSRMHYQGMLRVMRRENGIRVFATHQHGPEAPGAAQRRVRLDALVDVAVNLYAPLPAPCLGDLVRRLRFAAPQWRGELKGALQRAKQRLARARLDGLDWYWPAGEEPARAAPPETVRLLTPFDPLVWDRKRFELFWGWVYRFEAYTPPSRRKLGYYALPLLWRDRVIGWGNLSVDDGKLRTQIGFAETRAPRGRAFQRELEAELDRLRAFLAVD